MKHPIFRTFCAAALVPLTAIAAPAATLLLEDFEDSTVSYTASVADALDDVGNADYYGRLAPDTATPPANVDYGNAQGQGYYGVQDSDGALGGDGPVDQIQLDWTGIDTSNYTNLVLSWFLAEDTSSDGLEDWDFNTSFQIFAQIDGGGYNSIFAVEADEPNGDRVNNRPLVDTDFDGIGDGTEITDTFALFSSNIADGSVLDIRAQFSALNARDEDLAFDHLMLTGDAVVAAVPVPAAFGLAFSGLAMLGFIGRRRRAV